MKKIKIFLCILFLILTGCEHKISDSSQEARTAFDPETVSSLFDDKQLMDTATNMYSDMYNEWFSFISANRYYDNQKFQANYVYKIEREDIQTIEDIRTDYYNNFSKRYDFPLDLDEYKGVYTEKEDGLYAKLTWKNPSGTVYYPGKINEIGDDYVIYEIYCEDEATNIYDTHQTFSLVYSQEKWIYGTFFNEKENKEKLECKFPIGKYIALQDCDTYEYVGSNKKVTHIQEDRVLNVVSVKRHYLDGVHASYWGKCKNGSWICLSDQDGTYLNVRK